MRREREIGSKRAGAQRAIICYLSVCCMVHAFRVCWLLPLLLLLLLYSIHYSLSLFYVHRLRIYEIYIQIYLNNMYVEREIN